MQGAYLRIENVSVFHHGYYRCFSACITGNFAKLTVRGRYCLYSIYTYDNHPLTIKAVYIHDSFVVQL